MITIDLTREDEHWESEDALLLLAQKAVDATFEMLKLSTIDTELSLLFTNDAHIQEINAEWRHKDKPTNVLSFPAFPIQAGQKPKQLLGDIVLAWETINHEAKQDHKTFDNHLIHLIIHGLLHLLGYDHENEEDAEIMEGLERLILNRLDISDPYDISVNNNPDDVI